jgi:hypothetical protein
MAITDRIANKAAKQLADIIIGTLGEVDEVIIGTPAEIARPLQAIGMVKLYVRVGSELREHIALPITVLYRLIDHLVRSVKPRAGSDPSRSVNADIESALLNVLEGVDTKRYAATKPLRLDGLYQRGDSTELPITATWWSDNTIRIRLGF